MILLELIFHPIQFVKLCIECKYIPFKTFIFFNYQKAVIDALFNFFIEQATKFEKRLILFEAETIV